MRFINVKTTNASSTRQTKCSEYKMLLHSRHENVTVSVGVPANKRKGVFESHHCIFALLRGRSCLACLDPNILYQIYNSTKCVRGEKRRISVYGLPTHETNIILLQRLLTYNHTHKYTHAHTHMQQTRHRQRTTHLPLRSHFMSHAISIPNKSGNVSLGLLLPLVVSRPTLLNEAPINSKAPACTTLMTRQI
jgi:hypothetical protein